MPPLRSHAHIYCPRNDKQKLVLASNKIFLLQVPAVILISFTTTTHPVMQKKIDIMHSMTASENIKYKMRNA